MPDAVHIADQLVIAQKRIVAKVMGLQPPDSQCHRISAKLVRHFRMRQQVQATALITAPGACRLQVLHRVVAEQAFDISLQQIPALFFWNVGDKVRVRFGEKPLDAIKKKVNFRACTQEDTAQDKPGAAFRVGLTVSQPECRAP